MRDGRGYLPQSEVFPLQLWVQDRRSVQACMHVHIHLHARGLAACQSHFSPTLCTHTQKCPMRIRFEMPLCVTHAGGRGLSWIVRSLARNAHGIQREQRTAANHHHGLLPGCKGFGFRVPDLPHAQQQLQTLNPNPLARKPSTPRPKRVNPTGWLLNSLANPFAGQTRDAVGARARGCVQEPPRNPKSDGYSVNSRSLAHD